MRSLFPFKPTLTSDAVTPGSSMRTSITFVVSQTSIVGAQAPAIVGVCTAAASCNKENSQPMRSVSRFSSRRSSPAGPTLLALTRLTGIARLTTGARAHQRLQLFHEFRHIFEFQIDGGKSNVSNFVEFFEPSHDLLADLACGPFALRRLLHILFDRIDDRVQLLGRNRSLFASAQ